MGANMLDLSTTLNYYKRKEIQTGILEGGRDREVATRFESGFGKRPDTLSYESDIIELAKQKATSFHVSEEIWSNPLNLESTFSRKQLDELRTGWDLVLDIDCVDWEFSKLTAHLFIKALSENNIKSISCKFSGNKGFHIGVPFAAFPEVIMEKPTKDIFPEGPRKISSYLLDFIVNNYVEINNNTICFDKKFTFSLDDLKKKFGGKEFIVKNCLKCNLIIKDQVDNLNEFNCPKCENRVRSNKDFLQCEKCKTLMHKTSSSNSLCSCGSNEFMYNFNPLSVIEVDTVLIASRHLYRVAYSLHEKSGLASVPINPDKVLDFNKLVAKPENVIISKYKFLDDSASVTNEGSKLLVAALEHVKKKEKIDVKKDFAYDEIKEALPEQFFPNCIKHILKGLLDGKKRALFVIVNFLTSVGWSYDKIEEALKEWNKKNKEPLREVYIKGHIRYHKQRKQKILPPNCDNKAYYQDLQICNPDELCKKIKNPVNYSRRKTFYLVKEKKKGKVEKKG